MPWLNIPVAIVENDHKLTERLTYLTDTVISYSRSTSWITTRYVASDYTGAKAFRDALLVKYPPSASLTDPTIEAAVREASTGGGQYHVVATLKTITAWVKET